MSVWGSCSYGVEVSVKSLSWLLLHLIQAMLHRQNSHSSHALLCLHPEEFFRILCPIGKDEKVCVLTKSTVQRASKSSSSSSGQCRTCTQTFAEQE